MSSRPTGESHTEHGRDDNRFAPERAADGHEYRRTFPPYHDGESPQHGWLLSPGSAVSGAAANGFGAPFTQPKRRLHLTSVPSVSLVQGQYVTPHTLKRREAQSRAHGIHICSPGFVARLRTAVERIATLDRAHHIRLTARHIGVCCDNSHCGTAVGAGSAAGGVRGVRASPRTASRNKWVGASDGAAAPQGARALLSCAAGACCTYRCGRRWFEYTRVTHHTTAS